MFFRTRRVFTSLSASSYVLRKYHVVMDSEENFNRSARPLMRIIGMASCVPSQTLSEKSDIFFGVNITLSSMCRTRGPSSHCRFSIHIHLLPKDRRFCDRVVMFRRPNYPFGRASDRSVNGSETDMPLGLSLCATRFCVSHVKSSFIFCFLTLSFCFFRQVRWIEPMH